MIYAFTLILCPVKMYHLTLYIFITFFLTYYITVYYLTFLLNRETR